MYMVQLTQGKVSESASGLVTGINLLPPYHIMEFFNDIGGDPLKPSLFELVAQEQLRDLLQPTLKYVLAVSSDICQFCVCC
jgi:hypothetical protein